MKKELILFILCFSCFCNSDVINEAADKTTSQENNNQNSTGQTLGSASLVLSETAFFLPLNESKTITANALKENSATDTIIGLSKNEGVVFLSISNLEIYVTGLALGQTTIEVTSGSGIKAT